MTTQELSSIKEKLSKAYLYAVVGKVNYAISEEGKDLDGLGVDYTLVNHPVGKSRTVSSEKNVIHIQLKSTSCSSTRMFKEKEGAVEYNLTKALDPVGVHYLIVVQLPEDDDLDKWLEISEEELILRKCAYYLRINTLQKSGFLRIPKTNLFTPDSLPGLFTASEDKEMAY